MQLIQFNWTVYGVNVYEEMVEGLSVPQKCTIKIKRSPHLLPQPQSEKLLKQNQRRWRDLIYTTDQPLDYILKSDFLTDSSTKCITHSLLIITW